MRHSRIALHIAAALFGTLALAAAHAEPILKGKDINEKNLIEALTPAPADESEAEVRTRSISVRRDTPTAKPGEGAIKSVARAPEKKASASLLITFETNSADLTPRAKSSLDVVAKALQADKLAEFKFSIEGHADPRGGSEQNQQLSQARAESVVNYLASQHSIDRGRLKPVGKGSTELANTQRPDAPENRRVTITTLRE
jgi:outer membrane protein OmpA-like peptidoglycan-associated protein